MDFLYARKENAAAPGILVGKVVANYDDNYKGMVQVALYSYNEKANITDWVRVMSPMAGQNKGMYFLPEVGDEVLVAFLNNDINNPCVIGALWNEADTYPEGAVTKDNTAKVIVTKSGIQISISDEEGKETIKISAPDKTEIVISAEDDSIVIKDSMGKNKMEINGKKAAITIESDDKLVIKAKEIEINAAQKMILKSNQIEIKANNKFSTDSNQAEIKAKGSMKLESSGIAELKGSLVQINE